MIKSIAKAALVAVVASGLGVAFIAPASAAPAGRLCSFTSVTDPTVENGQTQTGQINGGPVSDDTQPTGTIQLICTIQVGGANSTHAGADSFRCAGSVSTGAASATCQANYVSPEGQPVYLCTEVTVNGTTYYRNSVAATWSATNDVPCSEAISQEIFPGPLGPVLDILFPILDGVIVIIDGVLTTLFDALTQIEKDHVDPTLCAQLIALSPGFPGVIITPEGDVYIDAVPYGNGDNNADPEEFFWDCPPYEA